MTTTTTYNMPAPPTAAAKAAAARQAEETRQRVQKAIDGINAMAKVAAKDGHDHILVMAPRQKGILGAVPKEEVACFHEAVSQMREGGWNVAELQDHESGAEYRISW